MRKELAGALAWAIGVGVPGAAGAEWQLATTRHFIVYADESAGEVRQLAEELERFDALMRLLHPSAAEETAAEETRAANRLTVFVVNGGQDGIRRVCGGCRDVAGFYLPRATGSVIYTPKRIGDGGKYDIDPQRVLFHEYGHHFLMGVFTSAYPAWFGEGYPEFVSTVRFDKQRAYLGEPAYHRAYGLTAGTGVSVETMFAPYGRKLSPIEREAIYGRGWVLTHMAKTDPAYAAKLNAYLRLLNTGTPSLEAARQAFGDLKSLDRAMMSYIAKPMQRVGIALDKLGDPKVELRPLTAGEAALIDARMTSTRGVDRKAAEALYARWAGSAARYPTDATVQGWLAEMAYDAGRDAEAEAAADRALAADPRSQQAMLYKAQVRLRRAEAAKATDPKVWAEARSWILKANKLNTDEAAPFVLFHRSFQMAGQKPSPGAVTGLYRAMELAPQDRGLRMAVARQALADGKVEVAKLALRPVAYDPHAAPDNPAMQLLQLLDKDGAPAALALLSKDEAATAAE